MTYSGSSRQASLHPESPLQSSITYTATVKGGSGGVTDLAGNPLASDSTWSFTTAAPPPPPPDEGPGGPILVISNAANPFSRYYAEILRAEGLNEFTATDISNVNSSVLGAHDVAILGEGALTTSQAEMLTEWVQGGGNLIAMRPDPKLAALLGLTSASGTLANGYLQVNTSSGPGEGIVGQTIQYHGTAARYILNGAQSIATLFSNATTSTANPAVTLRSVGSSGGQAAAFTYDLARSVVYTRQGNPAWAGEERDSSVGGGEPIRSDDLFFGAKAGDVQPDWVNLEKVAIPQADEQQHLLANLIEQMNRDRKPLPRFWFLPRGEKAAVVMTGDDHGNGGTVGRFEQYEGESPGGCSVADWQCVRGTSYIYPGTPISNSQAAAFQSNGFEIALHSQTNCENFTDLAQLESFYSSQLPEFAEQLPERRGSGHQPHPLHRLERLGRASRRPSASTASGSTPTTTTGRAMDSGSARHVHGLRNADALRGPRRLDDRRLPGGDADDRRVRTDVPVHDQHAARQGARSRGLLRRLHGEHAHRQRARAPARTRSSPRRRSVACRSSRQGRCSPGSMAATSRPSTHLVERQQTQLQRHPCGRGKRAAWDGADEFLRRRSELDQAQWHRGADNRPDDQGR